jgi:hypothetical protein
MPVKNGIVTAGELKKLFPHVPIIMFTMHAETAMRLPELHVDRIVSKSDSPSLLRHVYACLSYVAIRGQCCTVINSDKRLPTCYDGLVPLALTESPSSRLLRNPTERDPLSTIIIRNLGSEYVG